MAISKWTKSPLKHLCIRIGDGLHGTPTYDENSDVFFINGNNLKKGFIVVSADTKKVTNSDFESNYIELNDNSLLISINGTLGEMAFYNGEKIMLGKSAAYLNFKTGINRFYYYYFQMKDVQSYFHNVATGSTIKNLGLKSIQDFAVPFPEEKEWKPIARVLANLDKKIALSNKINTELEAMSKLIYDYWFVQFDFPDTNGKPYKSSGGKMVYNEALKREIPEGWDLKPLEYFVEVVTDTVTPSEICPTTPYIGLEHIPRKTIVLSSWETAAKVGSNKCAFKKMDILFGKIRPYFHKIGVGFIDGITSTDTIILRAKKAEFQGFALQTVFAELFVELATKSSTGTKMPRANWYVLKNYKIPTPSNKLLCIYQSLFDDVLAKIESCFFYN
jgi:type I restriction enzyme S subunit